MSVDPKVAKTIAPYGYAKDDPLVLGDPSAEPGVSCARKGGVCIQSRSCQETLKVQIPAEVVELAKLRWEVEPKPSSVT
jgi:hypothetical protein